MELHEAVEKASTPLHSSAVQLVQTPEGIDLVDVSHTLRDGTEYEYVDQLNPLVRRWGAVLGEEIQKVTAPVFDHHEQDEHDIVGQEYEKVFKTTGVELCVSVFSLGYQLGDPQYDRGVKNKKTFFRAIQDDGAVTRVLVTRFSKETFLRDQYEDKLGHAATYISMVYQQLNVDHTPDNVREWGKLTASLVLYDAFQTGLRTRRLMEEESAFDQIARNMEE